MVASKNPILERFHFPDSPITQTLLQKHENAKILYKKLMAAATTVTEWLNYLLETKNHDFIIQNIERRLSQSPCNRTIWEFYFNYLDEQNDIVSYIK